MLTEEQKIFVKEHYGCIKATKIAEELNVSIHSVYNFAKKENLSRSLSPVFDITMEQNQILLGGLLGDGSFKKNGSNYYYRECHAIPEKDYLIWKFNKLGNMTTGKIYDIPARVATQNPQVGLQTKNSPSINKYANMTRKEAIKHLGELGLMIWILDDGWIRHHSKKCDICVCAASFNNEELQEMLNKMEEIGLLKCHVTGTRSPDISIPSLNNNLIKRIAYKYFSKDMDIIKKKINDLKG